MNKRIIYTNDDGGVNVIIPTPTMFDPYSLDYKEMQKKLGRGPTVKLVQKELTPDELAEKAAAEAAGLVHEKQATGEWGPREEVIEPEPLTDEEILDYIKSKDVPNGKTSHVVDVQDLPTDRVFRNAWEKDGASLTISVPKAKEIKLNEFRELRAPLLAKLDMAYLKADETGDTEAKAAVVAQKNALRDVTKIALPDDLEELKVFVPEVLTVEVKTVAAPIIKPLK